MRFITMYSGLLLTSLLIRQRYSPMIPSMTICTPPRNKIVMIRDGQPHLT